MNLPIQLRGRFLFLGHFKNGEYSVLSMVRDKSNGNELIIKAKQKRNQQSKEADILQQLQHTNILKYIDHGETGQIMYLVTEHVKGEDLHEALARVSFTERSAAFVMYSLLKGLSYLHSLQIVHRDIRPDNIFLTFSGNGPSVVKIGDFGVAAKLINGTQYGEFGVSPFIAPEMIHVYNCKVDMYSAGIVLLGVTNSCKHVAPTVMMHVWTSFMFRPLLLDFFKGITDANPIIRLSADDALNHHWIQRYFHDC